MELCKIAVAGPLHLNATSSSMYWMHGVVKTTEA